MTSRHSRRDVLAWGTTTVLTGLAGCLGPVIGRSPEEQARQHEDAPARFTDVTTAIDEDHRTAGTYVRTDRGGHGAPFVNPDVGNWNPNDPRRCRTVSPKTVGTRH